MMETMNSNSRCQFCFICAHLHAGNLFVLGKIDEGGPVVLWSKPINTSSREEAEKIGKALSKSYNCPYGCTDPWELKHNGPDFKPDVKMRNQ